MNTQKLRELCARAMGWQLKALGLHTVLYGSGETWIHADDYDPLTHADQASELLETVADEIGGIWSVGKNRKKTYWCAIMGPLLEFNYFTDHRETQNLAKILCALRASDKVTDAEINDAMEGE